VWLDALTNYLTVLGYPNSANTREQVSNTVHIIGKDITKFHCLYWPFFLSKAGFPLPRKVISHSHWLKDNQKMSKSIGNVICPFELIEKYGADSVRTYFLSEGPYTRDANFNLEALHITHNNFLIDSYANLITRVKGKKILKNLSEDLNFHMIKADLFAETI
jgi:methionyl-tRNA synthetase